MDILVILGIIWVVYVGYSMVKKDGRRGLLTLIFLILAGLIWASGGKFGFDGDVAAIIFSAVFMIAIFIYDKQKATNKK